MYDSELGVTCHWCRQKTVEPHVFCTDDACGRGRSNPLAFCGMCLRNRHGEDIEDAIASGVWKCPKCRGSCGDGCVACCNCGPCRKANGLAPTHQVVNLARARGFDNAHDYLVHIATGASPSELLDRKKSFAWGKWLTEDFARAKAAADETEGVFEDADTDAAENDVENVEVVTPVQTKRGRGRPKKNTTIGTPSPATPPPISKSSTRALRSPEPETPMKKKRGRPPKVSTAPARAVARPSGSLSMRVLLVRARGPVPTAPLKRKRGRPSNASKVAAAKVKAAKTQADIRDYCRPRRAAAAAASAKIRSTADYDAMGEEAFFSVSERRARA